MSAHLPAADEVFAAGVRLTGDNVEREALHWHA